MPARPSGVVIDGFPEWPPQAYLGAAWWAYATLPLFSINELYVKADAHVSLLSGRKVPLADLEEILDFD